jgi:hypothetical protein
MSSEPRGGGSRYLYEPFERRVSNEGRQYSDLLRNLGTPEQIQVKLIALDELLEEKKRRDWIFGSIRRVAAWAAIVTGGWLATKGFLREFLTGIQ